MGCFNRASAFQQNVFYCLLLFIIGGRLGYKVEEEKFNSRNSSGNLEFNSYKASRKANLKWSIWNSVGKIGLWVWLISLIALIVTG
ncbi:hypothetical protein ABXQ82_14115 [Algibacter sp. 2305UL17-15]